ncbi:DUF5131 family protein [Solidesulfovibrio sp. C21]|uniref:DUF5131 family protein n=1 Tax=Solidesulfovibrio sp. C21 TaxID=3398613 RepID=UPI0039FCC949
MADKSKIQWCDATINPAYGCSPVSPACDHCYAARMAGRLGALTDGTHKDGKWTGKVNLRSERMLQALRWQRPRRIFIGSMTDLFHEAVPDWFLDEVFGIILANAHLERQARHQFIILTKRPERMWSYFSQEPPTAMIRRWATANDGVIIMDNPDVYFSEAVGGHCSGEWDEYGRLAGEYKDWGFANGLYPLPNTILMTTVEDQPRADERMPHLMELAGMGWKTGVSVEPMLGPVDLTGVEIPRAYGTCLLNALTGELRGHGTGTSLGMTGKISWTIVGCESGQHARAMNIEWVHNRYPRLAVHARILPDPPFPFAGGDGSVAQPPYDSEPWPQGGATPTPPGIPTA